MEGINNSHHFLGSCIIVRISKLFHIKSSESIIIITKLDIPYDDKSDTDLL
jgi:hypothetical protein